MGCDALEKSIREAKKYIEEAKKRLKGRKNRPIILPSLPPRPETKDPVEYLYSRVADYILTLKKMVELLKQGDHKADKSGKR